MSFISFCLLFRFFLFDFIELYYRLFCLCNDFRLPLPDFPTPLPRLCFCLHFILPCLYFAPFVPLPLPVPLPCHAALSFHALFASLFSVLFVSCFLLPCFALPCLAFALHGLPLLLFALVCVRCTLWLLRCFFSSDLICFVRTDVSHVCVLSIAWVCFGFRFDLFLCFASSYNFALLCLLSCSCHCFIFALLCSVCVSSNPL